MTGMDFSQNRVSAILPNKPRNDRDLYNKDVLKNSSTSIKSFKNMFGDGNIKNKKPPQPSLIRRTCFIVLN